MAYGGFQHVFSTKRAMTEPQHFPGRIVGGTYAAHMYEWVGARADPFQVSGDKYGDLGADIVQTMHKNDVLMAAVVAPLVVAPDF